MGSLSTFQFCCEPKIALDYKVDQKIKIKKAELLSTGAKCSLSVNWG